MNAPAIKLTRKDFRTDQDPRWCPGCGDYAVLASLQKLLPGLGIAKENFAFISGIGCNGRFPYYMNTYGFHTIHGRALSFATGLKAANTDLSVWVITGDGDSFSIGGNHLIHALRRNIDVKVILFNNEIYGLTKGQTSPTSEIGKRTKSTPMGSVDRPFQPLKLVLAAEATFIARTAAADPKHMTATLERVAGHKGTAFVEVLQNCNIFNDGAYGHITDKDKKKNAQLVLKHGEPLIFGENDDKAIVLDGFDLKVVNVADVDASEILVHDEKGHIALHRALSELTEPTAMGVIRAVDHATYEELVVNQIDAAIAHQGEGDMLTLLKGKNSWEVE